MTIYVIGSQGGKVAAAVAAVAPTITVPAAPTLTAPTAGNTQLSVPFTDGSNGGAAITAHKVYSGASAGALTLLGSFTTGSPFVDTGLTNGTARYYAMTAVNASNLESVQSNVVNGTPAAGGLPTFAYESEAQTLFTAMDAVGSTALTSRRKYHINRTIQRLKAAGLWAKMTWFCEAYYAQNEAQSLINWKNPSQSLSKIGTPTFAAGSGWSTTAATSRYSTGVPLSAIDATSFHMAVGANSPGVVSNGTLCGALTTGNLGLQISYSSSRMAGRAMGSALAAAASISNWNGTGDHAIGIGPDTTSGKAHIAHNGPFIEQPITTAANINDASTIDILCAPNITTFSAQVIRHFRLGSGLTRSETELMGAIVNDMYGPRIYGEPTFNDAGFGPSTVTADIIVYGTSLAAVATAYSAKRFDPTLNVIIVGDEGQSTPWALGGHPANNLGYADVYNGNAISGIYKDMIRWINAVYLGGRADPVWTNTIPGTGQGTPILQNNCSVDGGGWNAICRRMLDPTQTTGSFLPGLDIPVHWSKGVVSAAKPALGITSITTNDGRTFTANTNGVILGGDYNGLLAYLAGLTVIKGTEAAGTGAEASNGYLPPIATGTTKLPSGLPNVSGTSYRIDPYVTPGVPASGLIDGVIAAPSTASGAADLNGQQTINIRMPFTDTGTVYKRAPLPYDPNTGRDVVPANYNAADYARFSRLYAASGTNYTLATLLKLSSWGANVYDVNNGPVSGFSTDVPQSGADYANATDAAGREAVFQKVLQKTQGLLYWLAHSGDPNIPAATITSLANYNLNALLYTDPEPGWPLFCPRPYLRETTYRLKNTGMVIDGNDLSGTDGTTPAKSIKTIAALSYSGFDKHSVRLVAYNDGGGMAIFAQGGIGDQTSAGGADHIAPLPMEVVMPDASVCTNFLTPIYPSVTAVAYDFLRLEPNLVSAGQSCGMIAAMAVRNGTSVQAVPYATLKSNLQSAGDSTPLYLPTTN